MLKKKIQCDKKIHQYVFNQWVIEKNYLQKAKYYLLKEVINQTKLIFYKSLYIIYLLTYKISKIFVKMQKQKSFICLKCEKQIPMSKMQSHQKYQCDMDQNKKYGIVKEKQIESNQRKIVGQMSMSKNDKKSKVEEQKMQKKQKDMKQSWFSLKRPFIKKTSSTIKQQQKIQSKPKQNLADSKMEHKMTQNQYKKKFIQKSRIESSKLSQKSKRPALAPQSLMQFNGIQCTKCKKLIPIEEIDAHQIQCSYELECQYCGLLVNVMAIEQHESQCEIKKLWEQEQNGSNIYQHSHYNLRNIPPVNYNQIEYPKEDLEYSDIDNSQYYEYSQQQYNWQGQSQQEKPKNKGLTTSKLNNLHFTSYKPKPKQKQQGLKQKISSWWQKKQNDEKEEVQSKLKPVEYEQEPCAICYLNFQQDQTIIRLPCIHSFHPECVGQWFQNDNRCPLCKKNVV